MFAQSREFLTSIHAPLALIPSVHLRGVLSHPLFAALLRRDTAAIEAVLLTRDDAAARGNVPRSEIAVGDNAILLLANCDARKTPRCSRMNIQRHSRRLA